MLRRNIYHGGVRSVYMESSMYIPVEVREKLMGKKDLIEWGDGETHVQRP